jgi:hypothetical protein
MKASSAADTLTPKSTAALSIVAALSWLPMCQLPYEITILSDEYGLGTRASGCIATGELLVLASAAAWFGRTIGRRDKRLMTVAGILIGGAASIASAIVQQDIGVIFCRMLLGLGCGMIAAATNALPLLHREPERVFGYFNVTIGILFSLSNLAMDFVLQWGRERLFLVQFLFFVAIGGAALLLPRGIAYGSAAKAGVKATQRIPRAALACIFALALMWASMQAMWAFSEQAATARGLTEKEFVMWFTISGLTAPLGGVLAAVLGERYGYMAPLAAGFFTLTVSALTMYCIGGYSAYVVGVMLYNMPSMFTAAYLMGLIAVLDKSGGRAASFGGAASNFGGAVGPLLGVMVIKIQDPVPVGIVAVVLLSICLSLSVRAARQRISGGEVHHNARPDEFVH